MSIKLFSFTDKVQKIEESFRRFLPTIPNKVFSEQNVLIKRFYHYIIKIPLLNIDKSLKGKHLFIYPENASRKSFVDDSGIKLFMVPQDKLVDLDAARETLHSLDIYYTPVFREEFKRSLSAFYPTISVTGGSGIVNLLEVLSEQGDIERFTREFDRNFFVNKLPFEEVVKTFGFIVNITERVRSAGLESDLVKSLSFLKPKLDGIFSYLHQLQSELVEEQQSFPYWPREVDISKRLGDVEFMIDTLKDFFKVLFATANEVEEKSGAAISDSTAEDVLDGEPMADDLEDVAFDEGDVLEEETEDTLEETPEDEESFDFDKLKSTFN